VAGFCLVQKICTSTDNVAESPHIQQEFKEDNQSIRDNQGNDKEMKVCTVQHNLHTTTPSVKGVWREAEGRRRGMREENRGEEGRLRS